MKKVKVEFVHWGAAQWDAEIPKPRVGDKVIKDLSAEHKIFEHHVFEVTAIGKVGSRYIAEVDYVGFFVEEFYQDCLRVDKKLFAEKFECLDLKSPSGQILHSL
jgi:hypothetical protein